MKKLIICLVIMLLCSQTVLGAIPAKEREGKYVHELFEDVSETAWYNSYLIKLVNDGSIDGVIQGGKRFFKPESKLTKAEYITALLKPIIGVRKATSGRPWYDEYGKEALNRKLVQYTAITELNEPITREEMAVIAVAFLRDQKESLPTDSQKYKANIKDIDTIKEENLSDLLVCYGLGIITGYPNGDFGPQNVLKRSEAISVIGRIFYKDLRQPAKVVNTDIPEEQVVEGITVTRDDYVEGRDVITMDTAAKFAEVFFKSLNFYLDDDEHINVKGYVPELPEGMCWAGTISITNKDLSGEEVYIESVIDDRFSWVSQDNTYRNKEYFDVKSSVSINDFLYIFANLTIVNKNDIREGTIKMAYHADEYLEITEFQGLKKYECYYYDSNYGDKKFIIDVKKESMFSWEY